MKSSSFIYGKSLYYSFDPRAKIILTILMCIVVFFPMPLWFLSSLTAALLLFSLSQVKIKATLRSLKLILPMLLFMVLFLPFRERGGEVILEVHSITLVTKEGLYGLCEIANRFVFISIFFSLLSQTTKTEDILLALSSFRLPYSACLVLSLALRFIPTLGETFKEIKESQRLRLPNPEEEERSRNKIKSLMPTLIAALVVALKSIPSTGAALEMRGYGRKNRRSSYHSLKPLQRVFTHFAISVIIPAIILGFLEVYL